MNADLILNMTIMGLGMHLGAWRYREGSPFDYTNLEYFKQAAQTAERGKFHAMFLADTLAVSEENFERPNLGAMDPAIVLASIAGFTNHIGLVATASSTYNEPYNIARRFSSLDHLSGGRAAFNIVTTFVPDVAANFGIDGLPKGDDRYDRAEEFVDVVLALWESWEEGSLVGDKATGKFADASLVHPIDYKGKHFNVKGPLTLPRTPQGRPLLFQAGASGRGRDLAGRTADVVFTAQNTLGAAQRFRDDIKQRAKSFGRDPDSIKVMPGLVAVLGGTEAEAKRRKDELDHFAGDAELRKLALRVGVPVSALELDKPLPLELIESNDKFRGSQGFRAAAVQLGKEQGLTVREIVYQNGGGHLQVVGTPEQVADRIEHWYREDAVDGFNLMVDVLPSGLDAFVDHVVPLLQSRGLFQREYKGTTLRENLGLEH